MYIILRSDGLEVVRRLAIADNFFSRLKGLIGKKILAKDEGLLIKPCNSVHTCFMGFPIDVIFLNSAFEIVAMYKSMSPWRFSKVIKNAEMVLELADGKIKELDLKVGMKLLIENCSD